MRSAARRRVASHSQAVEADDLDRRARIELMYSRGLTLDEIAQAEDVTRQRVDQLLRQFGTVRRPRAARLYEYASQRGAEVESLFLQVRDDVAVARQLGLDVRVVRRIVDERVPDPA